MSDKVPMRMCIACREMKPKKELIRIVKNDAGITIDYKGKVNGRGAYICNDEACLRKCIKSRALNRAYKTEISEDVYNKLLEDFIENKNK